MDQGPHEKYRPSVRDKQGKTVKLKASAKNMINIVYKAVSTVLPKKVSKRNHVTENSASDDERLVYGIYRLNLVGVKIPQTVTLIDSPCIVGK